MEYLNTKILTRYNIFVGILDYCINEAIPSKKETHNNTNPGKLPKKKDKNKCIWWNDKCERITRIRDATGKSIRYKIDLKKFIEYKRVETLIKKTLREKKRVS